MHQRSGFIWNLPQYITFVSLIYITIYIHNISNSWVTVWMNSWWIRVTLQSGQDTKTFVDWKIIKQKNVRFFYWHIFNLLQEKALLFPEDYSSWRILISFNSPWFQSFQYIPYFRDWLHSISLAWAWILKTTTSLWWIWHMGCLICCKDVVVLGIPVLTYTEKTIPGVSK